MDILGLFRLHRHAYSMLFVFMIMYQYLAPLAGITVKVYMTDLFLFARLNLPNVLTSIAKKLFR